MEGGGNDYKGNNIDITEIYLVLGINAINSIN